MKKKIRKQIFKAIKKHRETFEILFLVLNILSLLTPFIVERVVYLQRIRIVELQPITEYSGNFGAQLTFSVSAFVIIERANGTTQYLECK